MMLDESDSKAVSPLALVGLSEVFILPWPWEPQSYHSGETWQHVLKSLSPQNMVKWDEKLILVKEQLKNQSMHLIGIALTTWWNQWEL